VQIKALHQPLGKLPWDLLQINFQEGSEPH